MTINLGTKCLLPFLAALTLCGAPEITSFEVGEFPRLSIFITNECPHCRDITNRLERLLGDIDSRIRKFHVYLCESADGCTSEQVRSVPTVRYYQTRHRFFTFAGQTNQDFRDFVLRHLTKRAPPSRRIPNAEIDKGSGVGAIVPSPYVVSVIFFVPEDLTDVSLSSFLSVYEKIYRHFKSTKALYIAKVECQHQSVLCATFDIRAPKMALFYHHILIEYLDSDLHFTQHIIRLNEVLNKYPTLQTAGYTPTESLRTENFDAMTSGGMVLVLVFSEKCVHCRFYLHVWEAASTSIRLAFPNIQLFKLNCFTSQAICSRLKVTFVPVIHLFVNGVSRKTMGASSFEKIHAFIQSYKTDL